MQVVAAALDFETREAVGDMRDVDSHPAPGEAKFWNHQRVRNGLPEHAC